MGRTILDFV